MSATHRDLGFAVIVEDVDHWSAEHRAAAEADPDGSYDDWVADQLREVMLRAGNEFIAARPDLFRGDLA